MRRLLYAFVAVAILMAPLHARRALPAIDTFTGTNSDPLSANWTTIDGTWIISSNAAAAQSSTGNAALWNADAFSNDQYAQVKVVTNGGWIAGPGVRLASLRGYIITVDNATSISIQRINSDENYTNLQTFGSLTVTSGDLWRLEAEGSTLRAYQNATLRGSTTDATYSSGAAGIFAYNAGAVFLDDFEGGNLAGGGDPPGAKPLCLRSLLGVGRC
jgi:hypothetical protein